MQRGDQFARMLRGAGSSIHVLAKDRPRADNRNLHRGAPNGLQQGVDRELGLSSRLLVDDRMHDPGEEKPARVLCQFVSDEYDVAGSAGLFQGAGDPAIARADVVDSDQVGQYTLGIEPATNHVLGKPFGRECGEIVWLDHDEARSYTTRFAVLDGAAEIAAVTERIRAIARQPEDDYPALSGRWDPIGGRAIR